MRYWTKAYRSVRIGIVSRPDMHYAAGPRLSIQVHPPVWIIGRGLHRPTARSESARTLGVRGSVPELLGSQAHGEKLKSAAEIAEFIRQALKEPELRVAVFLVRTGGTQKLMSPRT